MDCYLLKNQIENSHSLTDEEKFVVLSRLLALYVNKKTESIARDLTIRVLDQIRFYDGFTVIIRHLVRKSGLFPYLKSEFEQHSLNEKLLLSVYKPKNREDGFIFHSLQKKVYTSLIDKKNIVLSASTSVGKSAIVDSLIYSKEFNKIVIIVPTIALIDETRRRLSRLKDSKFQVISHGSQKINQENVVYVLTQERVLERDDLHNIDLLILDEFYKLNIDSEDDFRAITLNVAFSFLLKNSKQFYLIGPNIKSISGLDYLGRDYIFLSSDFSTVALNVYEYNLPTNDDVRFLKVTELLNADKSCTLIYCQSPNSVVKLAEKLISSKSLELSINEVDIDTSLIEWLKDSYHEDWIVLRALQCGIGIHHGALPRAIQQEMIKLFNNGSVKILLCTSTIIEGVNTSAKNVIVYDRRNANPLVSMFTYKNIQGRAGRMGRYFVGNVHCIEKLPEEGEDDSTVSVEAGVQSDNTPLSLLYGLESELLTESSRERLNSFHEGKLLPFEIFKRNTKYHPELIISLAEHVRSNIIGSWSTVMWSGIPTKEQARFLCSSLLILESKSLGRARLNDIDSLVALINQYLNSGSYSKFLKSKIDHYQNNGDISNTIDWLLSFLRNSIGHNLPYATGLISQVVTSLCESTGYKNKHDYGLVIHMMENYHLPGVYSALDEFGVPIQVVEKIINNAHVDLNLDELLNEIKKGSFDHLSQIERKFIENIS